MPLTEKGQKIMKNMKSQYGDKKGKSVFYASRNAGKIKGVDPESSVGSLEDIEFHENAATCDTVIDGASAHSVHKGYDSVVYGNDRGWKEDGDEPKGSTMSSNRDNGFGVHYGAEVDYFGPDTDYRAEEINPHHYGRDWEPAPFKDLFKTEEKAEEVGIRMREEYEYSEIATPGSVADKGLPSSLAYGALDYRDVDTELPDRRSFDSQKEFRRAQDKVDEDAPATGQLDTKWGKNIR